LVWYLVSVFQNIAISVSIFGIFPRLHYFTSVHSLRAGMDPYCRTSAICTHLYNVHCKIAEIMQELESK